MQTELCQQPRWKDAATKARGASATSTTAADLAPPEEDGEGPLFSDSGKGAPRLFVVREGEVFGFGGKLPFRAFDMVEFTKELAGIEDEEFEVAADDDEVGGAGHLGALVVGGRIIGHGTRKFCAGGEQAQTLLCPVP